MGRGVAALLVLLLLLNAGCIGDACEDTPVYAHVYVPFERMPENATLDAALLANGWTKGEPPGAYATHALADGRVAILHVGIPTADSLFVSANDTLIVKPDESRAILGPVVEPLAQALGARPPAYQGGGRHCGEV